MLRFALALLLASAALASADDIIILNNQSEVIGRIVSDDGVQVIVDVANPAGRVTLAFADIATINGLSAARLQSFRRETERAEKALASRGVALPRGLKKETRGIDNFVELMTAEAEGGSDLPYLARALSKFRLASPTWDAAAGIPEWRGDRRFAAWDRNSDVLRLIVPSSTDPGRYDHFWIAAGRRPESYPIAREVGRAAINRMFRLDARARAVPAWTDQALAFEAAETGLASAMALETMLDPQGLTTEQGDGAIALVPLSGAERETANAPTFLRVWRSVAEQDGARFFRTARLAGGWRLALRVMDDPPVSTEQILHPERYFAKRDYPTMVTLACPSIPEGAGSIGFIRSGSLGEAMIREALENPAGEARPGLDAAVARRAAEGWDGDAYVILGTATSEPVLVWFTVWDSPEDAQQFAEAAADAALLRAERGKKSSEGGRTKLDTTSGFGIVEVKGKEVVVVEAAATADVAAFFADSAWRDAVRQEEKGEPSVTAPSEDIAAALALTDRLEQGWSGDAPKADPLSGVVETDAAGARVFSAPGAFQVTVPAGWEAKAGPTSLTLSAKSEGGDATAVITFHRLPVTTHAALVFARAYTRSSPDDDGLFLPYETKTADGRGWLQFALKRGDRRVHLAWAVSGSRLVRVEATADAGGPGEQARRDLQAALGSLRFLK